LARNYNEDKNERFKNISALRAISSSVVNHANSGGEGWWSKLLHVRKIEPGKDSHSKLLSDTERVYELQIHDVKPDCIDRYLKQYEKASSHYEQAQKLLVALALRNSVENKLTAAWEREVRAEREQKEKIAKGARAWLLARFQSSPQLKAAAIERALQALGKSPASIPEDQDPIKQLFRDYVAEARRSMKK